MKDLPRRLSFRLSPCIRSVYTAWSFSPNLNYGRPDFLLISCCERAYAVDNRLYFSESDLINTQHIICLVFLSWVPVLNELNALYQSIFYLFFYLVCFRLLFVGWSVFSFCSMSLWSGSQYSLTNLVLANSFSIWRQSQIHTLCHGLTPPQISVKQAHIHWKFQLETLYRRLSGFWGLKPAILVPVSLYIVEIY